MAEFKFAKSYTLTNAIKVEAEEALVWNTGLCALGHPHTDEDAADAGKAVIVDTSVLMPEIKKNQVSVVIYGNKNLRAILNPGDTLVVAAETDEAAQFYLDQAVEGVLTVAETSPAAAASETPAEEGHEVTE